MVWTNWQGAMWRGAMVAVLLWAGLAWTQGPVTTPADPGERIFKVTENGKTVRCRVLQSWQLPDGRVAHFLESLESGEKLTIVDEQPPTGGPSLTYPREIPKRIYSWGKGAQTPPAGSPVPPHMRIDSGIVQKHETAPPPGAVAQGPAIVNRVIDDCAIGCGVNGQFESRPVARPKLMDRVFPRREVVYDSQVIDYSGKAITQNTIIQTEGTMNDGKVSPADGTKNEPPTIAGPGVIIAQGPVIAQRDHRFPRMHQWLAGERSGPTIVQPMPVRTETVSPLTTPVVVKKEMLPPAAIVDAKPGIEPNPAVPGVKISQAGGPTVEPKQVRTETPLPRELRPLVVETPKSNDMAAKKPWRPGDKLFGWLQGKPANTPSKTEGAKTDDTKKIKQSEDLLAQQNKVAEKKLADNVEKIYKTPFSTAMTNTPLPKTKPAETKTPVHQPLAIPNKEELTERSGMLPPPPDKDVRPASTDPDKREPWGIGSNDKVPQPGRPLNEMGVFPSEAAKLPAPPERKNDPLMSPDKLMPNTDRLKPKDTIISPYPRESNPPLTGGLPPRQEGTWPLGTASVHAAKSGLLGPVTYVPVPMATVPQPINPPMPPPPNMPDAPNLNAYVNAFTAPPAPKGAGQPGMMPGQAMNPYANPTPQQQFMMQQMYAQQQWQAQQQMLMMYGYRPTPAMMNSAYAQMPPSQGPMSNYSRQYVGPQAPNPFAANPMVQTGYYPAGYPVPMNQGGMSQPVNHQQTMPTQQQMVAQQVEQLVKVMRESPYPSQRESAAQSLASFEWRANPQIVPAMVSSASQDPAASVRVACVTCLGRMNAAVEPVFGALNVLRNDIDPRVRSAVEQAFVNLGQTPQ